APEGPAASEPAQGAPARVPAETDWDDAPALFPQPGREAQAAPADGADYNPDQPPDQDPDLDAFLAKAEPAEPEAGPELGDGPAPEIEASPMEETEADPEANPDANPDPSPETNPEASPDANPDADSWAEAEAEPEAEPEVPETHELDDLPLAPPSPASTGYRPKESQAPSRPPVAGAVDDQDRSEFLKSLMEGEGDVVPQKVELDLDGIFDMAKKEAETISPDSTFQPVEAPAPEEPPAAKEDIIDTAPLNSASQIRKVARFKMFILLGTVSLVGLGLLVVLYTLFFRGAPEPIQVAPPIQADPLEAHREVISGEKNLDGFVITLDDGDTPVVVEMNIILHYRDVADEPIIDSQINPIRDTIYRLTKYAGQALLTDSEKRVRFQADLLYTLNDLDRIKADPINPRLTYVQISLLRRR
ncbi:MAG: hypothetical protein LBJ61_08740, partial [Deltaproteobacteria bacterium]|nr:hypothetical protein [Deltaproteobacteria bacterium]